MMDLNFLGGVNVTKAALKGMKDNNGGRIVFISSQAGQVGVFGYTAYSASKFALRGFAESLQMEVLDEFASVVVQGARLTFLQ